MAMERQNAQFLAKVHPNYNRLDVDDYWKAFVMTYLGTAFMPEAGALLTSEAVTILQWLYDRSVVMEPELLNTIIQRGDEATLKIYLHSMMNDHLSKTDINKVRFLWFGKTLPLLGADMEVNVARGLITHFIRPVFKDAECALVIVEHKAFYLEIMREDVNMATPILNEMVELESYVTVKEELVSMLSNGE